MIKSRSPLAAAPLLALGGLASGLVGQEVAEPIESTETVATSAPKQISWYGSYADACEESARTGRPIFLMSAAPQCSGAPGMW